MNVETDIISSITASLIVKAEILVIMYVKSFKTAVIVLICIVIMCMFDITLTDSCQYQRQFADINNISL